jgi:hypothetical protein
MHRFPQYIGDGRQKPEAGRQKLEDGSLGTPNRAGGA